jgi:hypothetical protein
MEPPIVTAGNAINDVARFMAGGRVDYSAAHVVQILIDGCPAAG